MNEIANTQYPEAVKEHDLKVVSRPEMDVTDINENGIKYTISVYVKPEFELGQYEGVEVPFKDQVVTDEDVDAEIERMRKRNASLEEVEALSFSSAYISTTRASRTALHSKAARARTTT